MCTDHNCPDVLLFTGTKCPFCPTVKRSLEELKKSGHIKNLEIINLEEQPDIALKYNVQTVPWIRVGQYVLEGLHSKQEIHEWVEKHDTEKGMQEYLGYILGEGKVPLVISLIKEHEKIFDSVLELMRDANAKINVRVGIGAIIEEFEATEILISRINVLSSLTEHEDSRVRADACFYLSLTKNKTAIPAIEKLLDDVSEEVREVAFESLDDLKKINR